MFLDFAINELFLILQEQFFSVLSTDGITSPKPNLFTKPTELNPSRDKTQLDYSISALSEVPPLATTELRYAISYSLIFSTAEVPNSQFADFLNAAFLNYINDQLPQQVFISEDVINAFSNKYPNLHKLLPLTDALNPYVVSVKTFGTTKAVANNQYNAYSNHVTLSVVKQIAYDNQEKTTY